MMLAADPAISGTLVTAVATLLVGLFGGGTLVALLRVTADRGKVVIEAAQGAVIVQTGVIEALQEELSRLKAARAVDREERAADREEIARLQTEVARLRMESAAVSTRVGRVERSGSPGISDS